MTQPTMKAAIYDGQKVTIQEVGHPLLQSDQVMIKIHSAGICGTDLAIAQGHLPTPTPIILGHEFSGEVVECGSDVDQKWLHKRVVVEINANIDHDCYFCKRGVFTQCVERKALGIDIDGCFTEYISVSDYLLHEIPDNLDYDIATFVEPLAAAFQTFELMPLDEYDKTVVIYGLGKLGLLITQLALLKGLKVMVVDGNEKKLALARSYGDVVTINRHTQQPATLIKQTTNGIGADIVIDTTGNPEALDEILASCRTRGKLHMKSTHGLATPINLTEMVVREITMYTSRCGPFDKAIDALKNDDVSVSEMISHQYSLEQVVKALDSYADKDTIKTILAIIP